MSKFSIIRKTLNKIYLYKVNEMQITFWKD